MLDFSFYDHTYIDMSSSYQLEFGIAPISIDHLIVMSVWVRVVPISIDHLLISLCSIRVGTTPILIDHSPCQCSFWDRTYIDRSSSCHFEFGFLGLHPYQSAIFLSSYVRFQFLGPYLYQSIIVMSVQFEFLGLHLYWSTIFLSVCVQFESGPHLYRSVIVMSVWVPGAAPISIDHLLIILC